jgi:hypothetical protein
MNDNMSAELFKKTIDEGYTTKKDFIVLGGAMLNDETIKDTFVKIPLKTLNRHGLIAGATGTGKTKSLQVMAEQLSEKGIPSILMDLKGDLSGLAQPGEMNAHIEKRHGGIGLDYNPKPMPVELMTISTEKGVKLRATVIEFGPVLISKILGLNETQSGIMALVFKYCDDEKLALVDLKDLRKTLQYVSGEGKKAIEAEYGRISSASISTIMRKIIELEQQGADLFFGEKSFNVNDFMRQDPNGNGFINIIRLIDIQQKPKLFSTFMLSLLAEIYTTFPEGGDGDKPKLCIFIDEAHLVFSQASKELLDQIEMIIKLIRSKGVGIFFCTQNPQDVPEAVLGQLGLKIQHALRAFTAKDRKTIKKTAENYPITDFYDTETLLTSLGIGEAMVTVLNEKGIPTPLAATKMRAPLTRMDILTSTEIDAVNIKSQLSLKYNEEVDRESAYEILSKRMNKMDEVEAVEQREKDQEKHDKELEKIEARTKKEERALERDKARVEREKRRKRRELSKNVTTVTKAVKRATRSTKRSRKANDGTLMTVFRGLLGVLGLD